jgi:hypothetical protein
VITMKINYVFVLVSLLPSLALTACSESDEEYEVPVFTAADPTLSCPVGQVGWDFATGGQALPITGFITIDTYTCATRDISYARSCDGSSSCTLVCLRPPGSPIGTPAPSSVTYRCQADESPRTATARNTIAEGTYLEIQCASKATPGSNGAIPTSSSVPTPTGKKCVPAHCPDTMTRNAAMECVAQGKPKAHPYYDVALALDEVDIAVADPKQVALMGEVNYRADVTFFGGAPVANLPASEGLATVWIADEYTPKAGQSGSVVQGFRCTLGGIDIRGDWRNPVRDSKGYSNLRTSPECVAPASETHIVADAARRAELSVVDFKARYERTQLRAHISYDMEGTRIIHESMASRFPSECSGCAPNPPGFFTKGAGATRYIDWIGYYRQRELMPAPGVFATGVPMGNVILSQPTQMVITSTDLQINEPIVNASKFGQAGASFQLDFTYAVTGGNNPSNPYAFNANVAGINNMIKRNLVANVWLYPLEGQGNGRIFAGALPLTTGHPNGTTVSFRANLKRRDVNRFFQLQELSRINAMQVLLCLDTDVGRTFPAVTNGGLTYKAFIPPNCSVAPQAVVIVRDYLKRPLQEASASASDDAAADAESGNEKATSTQGNGSESDCTGPTCNGHQEASMGGKGFLGRTFFAANTDTSNTTNADRSGGATADVSAEALGYQLVDLPDDGTSTWADSVNLPTGFTLKAEIPWGDIEAAIDQANTGTNIEADDGKYGGRDGIGLAFGFKTRVQIGPVPGEINISIGAGISTGLMVVLKFKPEDAYPCLNPQPNGKCYALAAGNTQDDVRTACAKNGGILAEPRTDAELQTMKAILEEAGAAKYWLGGQSAFEYSDPTCGAATASAAEDCAIKSTVSYRWFSDDVEFAKAAADVSAATVSASSTHLADWNALAKSRSVAGGGFEDIGVAYNVAARRLVATNNNVQLPGLCEYEPVTSERYLKVTGGIEIGAGAGVKIEFCTPSSEIGICLEAGITFVDFTVGYEVFYEMRTLTQTDGRTLKVGGVGQDVPWELKLLAGYFNASFRFFFASAEVVIAEWPGFKVAGGSLFSTYKQIVERP